MKIDEGFWVALVGISIAAVCVIAAIIHSIREKRRMWRYHGATTPAKGWFFVLALITFCVRQSISDGFLQKFPLSVLFPTMDIAFLIGYSIVAIWAWSYVFRSDWHWRTGLWIVFHMLFPACFSFLLVSDLTVFRSISWVWIPAGFIAFFTAPYFARFAFEEMVARGQSEPNTSPQPDFRLWRPK